MKFPMNYICARQDFNTPERYVPQPYFRRKFEVRPGLTSATLLIGSLGFYEVHINGRDITKGEMSPYRSNPDHYVYFDSYDITDLMSEGENVLAAILGNGTQNTIVSIWGGTRFPWRSSPAVSFEIILKYGDESKEKIVSDEKTLCSDSPIIFNDFHFGEYYDARLEQPGWDCVDFDDSAWTAAIPRIAPRGKAKMSEVEPIVVHGEMKPVSITECDGGYIYDFGVNEAGLCRLHIDGTPGQKVLTRYFEVMVDGKPHYQNIHYKGHERTQEDEYICAGGEATHTPRFTYHGFRYVHVSGITPEQATPDLLTYLIIHSDVKKRGSFRCDNETVNKLQEATVRSSLCNLNHTPTDSPHRERNGWTADIALTSEEMLLNLAPENLWKQWLDNVYLSMNEDGMIPGIIPTGDWGYEDFNGPCWDCVLVWLPYYIYKYRGSKDILRDAATPIFRYINYLYNIIDAPGGLGDWAQVGRSSGRAFKTPVVFTDSVLSMDIARKAAFIYNELSMPEHAEFARKLEKRLYDGIRANLIDFETGVVCIDGNTQTTQAMTIAYGLVEGEQKKKIFDHLLALIKKDNEHMNVGVLGGRVIFRLLCDNGYEELAFKMITRPDFPSYGNWIARGYTTLCEFFDSEESGKIDSLNHHFWGDVSAWFYRYLAGIDVNPTAKDVDHVNIAPVFVEGVKQVSAEHILPAGRLAVEIKREENSGIIDITCPVSVHGEIRLPNGWRFENNETVVPLASGCYKIIK